jgi:hypothetical protein
VILRLNTLCGCVKYVEWPDGRPPYDFQLPLRSRLSHFSSGDTLPDVPMFRTRRFEYERSRTENDLKFHDYYETPVQ